MQMWRQFWAGGFLEPDAAGEAKPPLCWAPGVRSCAVVWSGPVLSGVALQGQF